MIVDAMRSDFIWQNGSRFTYVNEKLAQGEVLAFTTRAEPPTVTLPRLKSMMAGYLPPRPPAETHALQPVQPQSSCHGGHIRCGAWCQRVDEPCRAGPRWR